MNAVDMVEIPTLAGEAMVEAEEDTEVVAEEDTEEVEEDTEDMADSTIKAGTEESPAGSRMFRSIISLNRF